MTTVILSLHAKQPKRGLIAFDKGYVELYEYPRGQEAVITYTKDGHTETIREGETNRTLEYEVQDMEAAVAGEKDDMHLDYTRDVMDMMTQIREVAKVAKKVVALTDADIIVSGGRGVGGPEGFDIIYRLADKLNGVVGASRVAVDLGWIDFEHQVGQAGATVKPKIYIACGISGATQHIVGMWESDIVIAINIHRYAAIFNFADYGIVGDLFEVIPKLLEELEK